MLYRTEGIVLKTIPFGEADLIVSFLTPDYGLIKTFAKSPLKTKSRFGSSLEPLTHSLIAFWGKEGASLPRLTQADIVHSFQPIRDNMNCFLRISEIIELTFQFLLEREASRKLYSLLLQTLLNIENNLSEFFCTSSCKKGIAESLKDLSVVHYKVKLLKHLGYAPALDACGKCGKDGDCFFVSQGSILCGDCSRGMDISVKISKGVAKLYSNLLTWDIKKIKRIQPSNMLLSELSEIMDAHIKYIIAKTLNSKEFIRSLSCQF